MLRLTPSEAPSGQPDARPRQLVAGRLSDQLAVLVGNQIGAGALRPGDRLPTAQQLAQAHGVSRTVVREAIARAA